MQTIPQSNLMMLNTKLAIPVLRSKLVHRDRLFEMLEIGKTRKLSCVSAPAGFGKTTLVSEWCNEMLDAKHVVAWVSLDEMDNNPTVFWQYMASAFDAATPGLDTHFELFSYRENEMPTPSSLSALINIIHNFNKQIFWVIDDFHLINNNEIHEGIDYLLRHMPSNLHLTLISRTEPPLSLSRLRAQNAMLDICLDDLKFTMSETKMFLTEIEGIEMDSYQLGRLVSKTEGWIASLVLLIPTMKKLNSRKELDAVIEHFAGDYHYVLDFLTNEVLDQLTPDLRDFLLKTSILKELSSRLCDAVAETTGSIRKLRTLDQANTFIYPLNHQRTRFRYHTLFSEVLQIKLKQAYSADEIKQLHLNACTFHHEEEQSGLAIPHAIAARAYSLAIDLVYEHISLNRDVSITEFLQWLKRLPEEVLEQHPFLQLTAAELNLVQGDITESEHQLERIERIIELNSGDGDDSLEQARLGVSAVRAAIACVTGDYQNGISLAEQVLSECSENETSRNLLEYYLILAHQISGDNALSLDFLLDKIEESRFSEAQHYLSLKILLAMYYKERGKLFLAAQVYQEILDYLDARNLMNDMISTVVKIGISDIFREWNQLERIESVSEELLADFLVHQSGQPCWFHSTNSCLQLAQISLSQDDLEQAEQLIGIALNRAQQFYLIPELMHLVEAVRVRYWLAVNDLRKAHSWVQVKRGKGKQQSLKEKVLVARILLAEGNAPDALEMVNAVLELFDETILSQTLIETRLIQVMALWMLDIREDSIQSLGQLLSETEQEGWMRTIIEIHPQIRDCIQACLESLQRGQNGKAAWPSRKYLAQLLSQTAPAFEEADRGRKKIKIIDYSFESLTQREQAVMELLAKGYSSGKIAKTLTISLSTSKTHIRNIYAKLAVHNREDALSRAEELELVSPYR